MKMGPVESERHISQCAGKQPLTRAHAAEVASRHNGKHRAAYKCRFCAMWHVGEILPKTLRAKKPNRGSI